MGAAAPRLRDVFHLARHSRPWLTPWPPGIRSGSKRILVKIDGGSMRPLAWIGIVVLVLGILSFVVPFPTSQSHGIKMGDASVGITTHHDEKLSPAIGGVLCAAGVVLLIAGSRKAAA